MFDLQLTKLMPYGYRFWSIIFMSLAVSACSKAQLPDPVLQFPEGKDVVEIPFERDRGWIIIKVQVNESKPLSFIVDTGAPIAILVRDSLADQLSLSLLGNVSVKGADANAAKSVPLANNITFTINGLRITNGFMAVGAASGAVSGADGIIGKYLFGEAVVRIDWNQRKLIVTKPEKFAYQGKGEILPVRSTAGGHFYTNLILETNGKSVPTKAAIDLGNVSSYVWVGKNKNTAPSKATKQLANIITGWGANGPYYGTVSRASLTLGSMHLDSVVTVFKNSTTNEEVEGNIGMALLERYTPTFDYPHHQLILETNEASSGPFTFNQSGIIIAPIQDTDFLTIAGVIPGSPASDEGLRASDKIRSINGININILTKNIIKDLLIGKNSASIELDLKRGDSVFARRLKMRKLI